MAWRHGSQRMAARRLEWVGPTRARRGAAAPAKSVHRGAATALRSAAAAVSTEV
jgi:hypothetical protein